MHGEKSLVETLIKNKPTWSCAGNEAEQQAFHEKKHDSFSAQNIPTDNTTP